MAAVTITDFMPGYTFWSNIQGDDSGSPALITTRTASSFRFTVATTGDFAGWKVIVGGSGFTYLPNETDGTLEPTGGLVNSISIRDAANNVVMTINSFPVGEKPELVELYYSLFGTSSQVAPDLFNMFTSLLLFNDVINGSNGDDDIAAGRNHGNDTIFGNAGNDYIKGDAGSDTIDGGSDFDTLSYAETFYDPLAFKGINLNVNTGIVQDSWGGTDTFSNFERIEGSRFKDVMIGSDTDRDRFLGLRGADVLDGGGANVVGGNGGRDFAIYNQDARYGGDRGIVVNLELSFIGGVVEGTIRDGFGQTDIVRNIERVVGTMSNDTFNGSFLNNVFEGLSGRDKYDGKDGSDRVDFYNIDQHGADHGVTVVLTRATNQVVDDGFGFVENMISIENVGGSVFSDIIRGSDGINNYIEGFGGADLLRGGAGEDGFGYYGNFEFGDQIQDFETGIDKVYLGIGAIDGLDNVLRFNLGSSATQAGPSFYFNAADRTLYYDRDGSGLAFGGEAVFTVQVGASVAAGDLILD